MAAHERQYDQEREWLLYQLHNDRYPEELLGETFDFITQHVLTTRERLVLSFKVQHTSDKRICQLLCIQPASLRQMVYNIRAKFRHGMATRVDDTVRREKFKRGIRTHG